MTSRRAPSPAVLATGVAVACLVLGAFSFARPDAAPALSIGLFAAGAVMSGQAWHRHRGLDRMGWGLVSAALVSLVVGGLICAGSFSGVAMAVVGCVALSLATVGLLCLAVPSVGELVAGCLQTSMLANAVLITVWTSREPHELRWGSGPVHDMHKVLDCLLVISLAAAYHAVLTVVARTGRSRVSTGLLCAAMVVGAFAQTAYWAFPSDHPMARLGMACVVPQLVLFLVGATDAATAPPDDRRRPVVEHTRSATLLTVVLIAVCVALVSSHNDGLDMTTAHAMSILVCQLVASHVTEARRSRSLTASVERQERHLRLLVSETRDIIMELDEAGRILFASEALRSILGLQQGDWEGRPVADVIPNLTAESLTHVVHSPTARVQPTMRLDSVITTAGGVQVHAESVVTPLPTGYLVAVRDVSERVGLQSRLQQVTYHDVATGLPNRSHLDRELRRRLFEAASGDIAVVLVEHGEPHATGSLADELPSEVLGRVASTVRDAARPGDLVARYSDHRFAVLLTPGTAADEAMSVARAVVDAVQEGAGDPVGHGVDVAAGVSVGSSNGGDLLRNAELALRQAHLAGPGAVRLFEASMLAQYARTRDLRRRLALPPNGERWTLLYQPVVDLQTGRTSGVEALLRWTDPEGDLLGIEEIVRLAEEFGSIVPIGTWVLDQAAAQAARWVQAGRPLHVAVNVSVHQLMAPDFPSIVEQTLVRHGIEPSLLTVEITETVMLERSAQTLDTLSRLRALGVRIAIDDFGTGYTGLANLRSLPLDVVKIDRSFVQGLGEGGGDEAVVKAVAKLGLELGLAITVEGVETAEQERLARSLGITSAQGYLYARPVPPADITALVAQADAAVEVTR